MNYFILLQMLKKKILNPNYDPIKPKWRTNCHRIFCIISTFSDSGARSIDPEGLDPLHSADAIQT
jgi:hypothetical protein